jgi:hypothetical protein
MPSIGSHPRRAHRRDLMADFSCASTKRTSHWPSWQAPVRFRVSVVVATLALTGCNANQAVNRTAPGVVAGPDFPNYNPYDPTKYAQTSGFYAGFSGGH